MSLNFVADKKIVKDVQTLQSIFKPVTADVNVMKLSVLHSVTNTKFLMDVKYDNGELMIKYEHRSGEENITEYIIKSLNFLMRKDSTI